MYSNLHIYDVSPTTRSPFSKNPSMSQLRSINKKDDLILPLLNDKYDYREKVSPFLNRKNSVEEFDYKNDYRLMRSDSNLDLKSIDQSQQSPLSSKGLHRKNKSYVTPLK